MEHHAALRVGNGDGAVDVGVDRNFSEELRQIEVRAQTAVVSQHQGEYLLDGPERPGRLLFERRSEIGIHDLRGMDRLLLLAAEVIEREQPYRCDGARRNQQDRGARSPERIHDCEVARSIGCEGCIVVLTTR